MLIIALFPVGIKAHARSFGEFDDGLAVAGLQESGQERLEPFSNGEDHIRVLDHAGLRRPQRRHMLRDRAVEDESGLSRFPHDGGDEAVDRFHGGGNPHLRSGRDCRQREDACCKRKLSKATHVVLSSHTLCLLPKETSRSRPSLSTSVGAVRLTRTCPAPARPNESPGMTATFSSLRRPSAKSSPDSSVCRTSAKMNMPPSGMCASMVEQACSLSTTSLARSSSSLRIMSHSANSFDSAKAEA